MAPRSGSFSPNEPSIDTPRIPSPAQDRRVRNPRRGGQDIQSADCGKLREDQRALEGGTGCEGGRRSASRESVSPIAARSSGRVLDEEVVADRSGYGQAIDPLERFRNENPQSAANGRRGIDGRDGTLERLADVRTWNAREHWSVHLVVVERVAVVVVPVTDETRCHLGPLSILHSLVGAWMGTSLIAEHARCTAPRAPTGLSPRADPR